MTTIEEDLISIINGDYSNYKEEPVINEFIKESLILFGFEEDE